MMKVLLDENLPHELRHYMAVHDVFTVQYLGWEGTRNGALLRRAAEHGFEVIVTQDAGFAVQHNLATLPVGVAILHAPTNTMRDLTLLVPELLSALHGFVPKRIIHIGR